LSLVVLLTGSCDPSTRGRLACVADALTHAGRSVAAIVPTSHRDSGVGPNARFFPARRRDDAFLALSVLAGEGPIIIECFDADAARCAREWCVNNHSRAPLLIDADAVRQDPGVAAIADAIIAPTDAHAEFCVASGIERSRVLVAPCPVQPRGVFEPGGDSVLCLTPIAPGRGLTELIDAWAASGCGTESNWVLRFGGPIEDTDFAHELAGRAAGCPGVILTERVGEPDHEIATAAVLIDPQGHACPNVLNAVARARAVFAPAGSPTAEAACEPDGPFVFPTGRGVRGLITVFDRLGGSRAADLADPGRQARERLLTRHGFAHATAARRLVHDRAPALADASNATTDPGVTRTMPRTWAQWARARQNPDNTRRLQRAMLACHSRGFRRVALYGAGAFIKSCADALCEPRLDIVGLIDDDNNKLGKRIFGFTILCPDVALTADLHAVIITAPTAEERIWQRTAWFRQAGIRVIALHQEHAEIFSSRAA
jgi:hypothetical protein